jgi:hypothetical protein
VLISNPFPCGTTKVFSILFFKKDTFLNLTLFHNF